MKFKVGDKVRINEQYASDDDKETIFYVGCEGIIIDVSPSLTYPYSVDLGLASEDAFLMDEIELDLVED